LVHRLIEKKKTIERRGGKEKRFKQIRKLLIQAMNIYTLELEDIDKTKTKTQAF